MVNHTGGYLPKHFKGFIKTLNVLVQVITLIFFLQ